MHHALHARVIKSFVHKKKGSGFRHSPSLHHGLYQVQVITPLVISQVFADCECVAVALHDGGGPATAVTTIVTFCDGVKPWTGDAEVAVPEKYAPWLSAAYCSS